jgi:hypothetical protein
MPRSDDWIKQLSKPEIRTFLRENENKDTYELSLKVSDIHGVPIQIVAEQILSRQKARTKLPSWYKNDCILFPPATNLEQASSEITARYKSELIAGEQLIDLTGGTGVDTYYLSQKFKRSVFVESDSFLCRLAQHNFECLDADIDVTYANADGYLEKLDPNGLVFFIDPSRRNQDRKRVFKISDCSPDILALKESLLKKGICTLIKLSPILDLHKTVADLSGACHELHIVAVDNEVKELLVVMLQAPEKKPLIKAVNLLKTGEKQVFKFTENDETKAQAKFGDYGPYLYEPNAAILKSGAFALISERFNIVKASPNTHLYFSEESIKDFPGRRFKVIKVVDYQPKILKREFNKQKANVTVRNFPHDVKEIRKRLGLRDGGSDYIFFYRGLNGLLRTAVCKKF